MVTGLQFFRCFTVFHREVMVVFCFAGIYVCVIVHGASK